MAHKLIFATHNEHKLVEVRQMLEPTGLKIVSAGELNLSDVEETGKTFKDNALLKAYAAYTQTGIPALAEDSGLCINALDGRPGILSARYAKQHGGYPKVFEAINAELGNNPDRSAYYQATMALVFSDMEAYTFDGIMEGTLAKEPIGSNGFGYDPIFIPTGYNQTVGQLSADVKNKISHRYKALQQVFEFLKTHKN